MITKEEIDKMSESELRDLWKKIQEAFCDANTETIKDNPSPLKMCDACAFKKGTLANQTPETISLILESIADEVPFFCHKGLSDTQEPYQICNGYINIMKVINSEKEIT